MLVDGLDSQFIEERVLKSLFGSQPPIGTILQNCPQKISKFLTESAAFQNLD